MWSLTRARWSATSRKNGSTSSSISSGNGRVAHALQGLRERVRGPSELQHLALEPVDRGDVGVLGPGEHLLLDAFHVIRQRPLDEHVVVDHAVHDRVQHRGWAQGQLVAVELEAVAHVAQRVALTATDRDDEAVPDEDHDLTGLDVGGLLEIAQGLQHREDAAFVRLDLGPLVALDRVLDRERVQRQLVVDRVELRVGRVLEPDPDEPVAQRPQLLQLVAEVTAGVPNPATVDGLVHDHATLSPRQRALAPADT